MYEDMPQRHVQEIFSYLLYGDQPAGWDIAGTKELVRSMTRDHFVNYRDLHYVAKSTIVIVAGKINEKIVRKQVQDAFAKISSTKKGGKLPVKENQTEPALVIKEKKTDQMHVVLGVRSYDIFNKKLAPLRVLATALGGGMSSRLFRKMRDEMGVCYYVRAGSDEFTDHGVFSISAGVDKNRLIESVTAIIEECKKFANEPISEAELRKTKDYIIGNLFLGLESSDSVAEFAGMQEVLKGEVMKPKEMVEKIEKVTAKDIQKIARELFQDKHLNLAVLGDVTDKDGLKKVLTFNS